LDELVQELGVYVRGITPEAMECLLAHDWPGNVRELKNVLERSLHFMENGMVDVEHLPFHMRQKRGKREDDFSLKRAVERAEKEAMERAIRAADGNRERAIRLLGISRSSFYQKVKKYRLNLDIPGEGDPTA
jgi:transcriptional regulator with PAS, ATPase and Fis domain